MPTDPARRLERAVVDLTTQVRRIADAMPTPTDDTPTTGDDGPDVAGYVYREALLTLLSRMQRGALLDAERDLLREHVEHLIRDRDRLAAALDRARAAERRLRDACCLAGVELSPALQRTWLDLIDALDGQAADTTEEH